MKHTQNCVYFGDKQELEDPQKKDDREVFACKIHEFCMREGEAFPYASCELCEDDTIISQEDFGDKFIDHLGITDSNLVPTTALRGLLKGGTAFLVGGGPSVRDQPIELLNQRGVFSIAVNNMAGNCDFKPNSFVCADPPSKFHNGIWQDPSIMKFIPTPKIRKKRGGVRKKVGDEFIELGKSACEMPNVWGFHRRSWLVPDDTFFTVDEAAWGNHNDGVARTGEKKTACTMLLALRLLYYLGARKIYLVGVDFQMQYGRELTQNYAFDENRDNNAIRSNNEQYLIVNDWLCRMMTNGTFKRFGVELFNCCPNSGLKPFSYVKFEEAIADALSDFPLTPFDLTGWYYKKPKPKKK